MPDDLDQLIRAAMKTLDAEVPSGYFEALPNQTIARLEGSMQHGSSGTTETRDTVMTPPPMALEGEDTAESRQPAPAPAREEDREDSGLHDIRNLAQSTKQRLSSRRITAHPPMEDDVLASSSGSFKNIALPQPAKMVSLPELDELPPAAEVAAADKAARKAAKEAAKEATKARKSEQKLEAVAAPAIAATTAAAVEAPATASVTTAPAASRASFALPSQQKKGKGPVIALVGVGLAAAAGAVIYMQMSKSSDQAQQAAPAVAQAPVKVETVAPAAAQPPPPPAPEPQVTPIEPPPEAAVAAPAEEPKVDDKADAADDRKKTRAKAKKAELEKVVAPETAKVEAKKPSDKKGAPATGGETEPSFDALLKEAGVAEKKEQKPKLDKKSLTGDDFKKGMAGVVPKAKGCYTGTQGTATVKLTIAPSGQVTKVSVAGDFAGKPEGACIEAALRAATFPAWDGGPQTFHYAVLLSD